MKNGLSTRLDELRGSGHDYYDRHSQPFGPEAIVESWGAAATAGARTPTYTVVVDMTRVQRYAEKYKAMLVVRNGSWENVDAFNDTAIEKSVLYTIDGPKLQISFQGNGNIKFAAGLPSEVLFYVVLLPNNIRADQITRLSDVKSLGGRIIAITGQAVTGAPLHQALPSPK